MPVSQNGKVSVQLEFDLENYHDFDLKDAVASSEVGKLTFSESPSTTTTILTENQTFYVSCVDSLLSLSAIVNNSNTLNQEQTAGFDNSSTAFGIANSLKTSTILLTNNIDFKDESTLPNRQGSTNFEAIGRSNESLRFEGDFNGQSFTISNIIIEGSDNYQGLFGSMHGNLTNLNVDNFSISGNMNVGGVVGYFGRTDGQARTLSNVNVDNMIINGGIYVGGVVGYLGWSNVNLIEVNQTTATTITGSQQVGGVAGCKAFGTLSSCSVAQGVTITATNTDNAYVGGIVGSNLGVKDISSIDNCTNNATVNATSESSRFNLMAGGIAGENQGIINNCVNLGNIYAYSASGGIAGVNSYAQASGADGVENFPAQIESCSNSGEISGFVNVGGIAGDNNTGTILGTSSNNIVNTGAVIGVGEGTSTDTDETVNSQIIGGIVGSLRNGASVQYVKNESAVSGGSSVAGIAGAVENANVSYATNNGNVTADYRVGGIVGWIENGNISSNFNYGTIVSSVIDKSNFVGGIVGSAVSVENVDDTVIVNCENFGHVDSNLTNATGYENYVGGIAGWIGDNVKISGCINQSVAEIIGNNIVGGVVGSNNGHVVDCTNHGYVFALSSIGGIIGKNSGTISSCVNTKSLTNVLSGTNFNVTYDNNTLTTQYVGGFVGYNMGGVISNLTNTVNHVGTNFVAGISGVSDEGKIEKCYNNATIQGTVYVAGIVSNIQNGFVVDCANQSGASVIGQTYCGGITGTLMRTLATYQAIIKNCNNAGTISGSYQVGGIAGVIGGIVSNCYNTGTIKGIYTIDLESYDGKPSSSINIGGIGGYSNYIDRENISPNYQNPNADSIFAEVYNCWNSGNVYAELVSGKVAQNIGGIIGYKYQGPLSGCYNTATIGLSSHTSSTFVGGLFGYAEGGIANCFNTGAVYANTCAGGIAGQTQYPTISNCYNTGAVTVKTEQAGGLVGQSIGVTIRNSYNNGVVNGNGAVAGGIVGFVITNANIANSYNLNAITASIGAGGIVGYMYNGANIVINACVNQGNVTGNTQGIGGIMGFGGASGSLTITASTNYGTINGGSAGQYVGGIIGLMQIGTIGGSSANACYNYGKIVSAFSSSEYYNIIGGIFGYAQSGTISYCYNRGSIQCTGSPSYYYSVGFSNGVTLSNIQTNNVVSGGDFQGACNESTDYISVVTNYTSTPAYTSSTLLTVLNNYVNSNVQIQDSASDLYGGSGIYVQLDSWTSQSPWPIVNQSIIQVDIPDVI